MQTLFSIEWWQVIVAGIATLAIYSFLYRENYYYRFFEHLFIGVATGLGVMGTIENTIWPQLLSPLIGFNRVQYPDGTWSEPYDQSALFLLVPAAFGLLYYFIYSRRHQWLAQLVIGFGLGCSGGLAFKGLCNEMLPQVIESMRPLYVQGDYIKSLSNTVFIITLVSTMWYFFFTWKRREGGLSGGISATGRWLMMGCFGAFFGSTIMARMALLVERLEFLINDWWLAISLLVSKQ